MDPKKVIEECRKIDKEYHYFNAINEKAKTEGKGKLEGIAVSVKDCICVKGMESRAGSKILEGYKPVFDATVVEKARKEGAIIIGKTAQDAFGFGTFSVNVGKGMKIPLNPFDKERACGGSSGGGAGLTQKATFRHIALGQSTGGSIAAPASFCGVVGLCPTYGRVSRYGLMDYANSLDKIGPISKNVEDAALMLEIIAGFDGKESTTLDEAVPRYTDFLKKGIKGIKIGVIKEAFGEGVDDEVKDKVEDGIKKLESQGAKTEKISLPLTEKYVIPTYYLLAMCEASTNLAKYCGMRYGAAGTVKGNFNEYFSKVRSEHFNDESKRRIIIGTFARMAGYRDAYYIKAAKVRTRIIEEYKKAFKKVDVLVSPTMPFTAPKIKEIEKLTPLQSYTADILTAGPNLAGLPHISIPVGVDKNKMPVGLMLTGDHLQEGKLIQAGSEIENGI
ncbi:aspartyl/glutamyl-tRNA amidotransferase subunit A [Candidatus Woesearchaeota archaeon]|nr:aspartyl/glutamyl-tRNA amidotransferase subunit A [Candidatus Woesearchaeota archaeon]